MSSDIIDTLVIGSGPAGLSAAIYVRQAGFKPVILKGITGSLVATTGDVVNYLGMKTTGAALDASFRKHAEELGIESIHDMAQAVTHDISTGLFTTTRSMGDPIVSRSVIYAAGASPKELGISGEKMEAVSYCATCDGGFYEGDPSVVVVGGGDTAVEDAIYMANIVDQVHLLVRGDKLRAAGDLQNQLAATSNVTVHYNTVVDSVEELEDMEILLKTTGAQEELRVSGLFVAIGQDPNTAPVADLVDLDGSGYIDSVKLKRNAPAGFFAAGDLLSDAVRQISVASASGTVAGLASGDYLRRSATEPQGTEFGILPAGEYLVVDPGVVLPGDPTDTVMALQLGDENSPLDMRFGYVNGSIAAVVIVCDDGIYKTSLGEGQEVVTDTGSIGFFKKESIDWDSLESRKTPEYIETLVTVKLDEAATIVTPNQDTIELRSDSGVKLTINL